MKIPKIFLLAFIVLLASNMSSFSKETASTGDMLSGASTSEKIDILADEIEKLKNQKLQNTL